MIGKQCNRYCCDNISNIENYEQAVADKEHIWECHHRGEILPCGVFTQSDLIEHGLFWNRPSSELVFLRHDKHKQIHKKGTAPRLRKDIWAQKEKVLHLLSEGLSQRDVARVMGCSRQVVANIIGKVMDAWRTSP